MIAFKRIAAPEFVAPWVSVAFDWTQAKHITINVMERRGSDHKRWARDLAQALAPMSLPGGYPNFLGPHAQEQIAHAYGNNLIRLQAVKRRFDPEGCFSATPFSFR